MNGKIFSTPCFQVFCQKTLSFKGIYKAREQQYIMLVRQKFTKPASKGICLFGKLVIMLFLACATMGFGQWTQVASGVPSTAYVWCLAVKDNTVFAGTGPGVFRSTNNGISWTAVDSGIPTAVYSLATSGIRIFAGTGGAGVFLSTDNGTNWTAVDSGLPARISVKSLAVTSFGNVYAGTSGGLFQSQNFGTSWTAVSGFPTASILSLAASGIHDVFVGVGNNFLVSTNGGASWSTSVSWGPLVGIGVFSIAVTTSGSVFAGTGSGVFLSTTDRSTWTSVNSGLTDTNVFSLAVSSGNLFAGTYSGNVFFSTNNGASWTAVGSGLPLNGEISCLAVSDSNVFAGTYGNGLWRRPLSEMIPSTNYDFQNKQPSVNGLRINLNKTIVTASMPLSDGPVTIGLFTVAGKRIYFATHQAHDGMVNIPVSGLSTGLCIMSITSRNSSVSSSFVITK